MKHNQEIKLKLSPLVPIANGAHLYILLSRIRLLWLASPPRPYPAMARILLIPQDLLKHITWFHSTLTGANCRIWHLTHVLQFMLIHQIPVLNIFLSTMNKLAPEIS